MKLSYLSLILVLSCACGQPGQEMYPDIADAARTSFCVASDDTALVKIFDWAVSNSNRYVGEDSDPVGPWYEAALPNRPGFLHAGCLSSMYRRGAERVWQAKCEYDG